MAHMKEYSPAEDGTLFTTRFSGPYRHDYYGTRIFQAAVAAARASLVLSTYGHLMPDSEKRTRRAIDDAWSSAPDVPRDEGYKA